MEETTSAFQTKPADIPIRMYKTVQTGPNIQLGGLKNGFSNVRYHPEIESAVENPEKNPINKQIPIEIGSFKFLGIFIACLSSKVRLDFHSELLINNACNPQKIPLFGF